MTDLGFLEFEREVLAMVAQDGRVTVASVVLKLGLDSVRARAWLKRMVDEGLLEIDSTAGGTLFFHAPGLSHLDTASLHEPMAPVTRGLRDHLPRSRLGRGLGVFSALSFLWGIGLGIAAAIVYPKWESETLLWLSLIGAPGTLLAVGWGVHKALAPARPERWQVRVRVDAEAQQVSAEHPLEEETHERKAAG